MLDGKAEMFEQHSRWRGLAEAIDTDDRGARIVDSTDVLVPETSHAGLDRDTWHSDRQNACPIRSVLSVEERSARHRHYTYRDARFGQLLLRAERQRNLGSGGDDDRTKVGAIAQHVAAASNRCDLIGV